MGAKAKQVNNNRLTALEWTATKTTGERVGGSGGGVNISYCPNLALDSAVGKTYLVLSSHSGLLTFAVHCHRETMKQSIQINIVTLVKQGIKGSHIVRGKENLKLSRDGPSERQSSDQAATHQ